ncbi:MAG: hypothetical protein R3B72_28280 [Polyangiaceae bacterium]
MKLVPLLLLAVALAACGDDAGSCEKADDCPAIECDDGTTVRICLNGECSTKDEACGSGDQTGGW